MQDALDLADGLGLERFAVVGHDWGARVAYSLAALVPERIRAIAALALAYQPRAAFSMPDFAQARAFWYQWLMYLDAGVEAIRPDPVGFARIHHRMMLDGVGHFPHREAAESVAEHVHQHLNRHRS